MSSFYRQQLEDWLKGLDVIADTVFDVGGSQLPVKDRVRNWDVKEYKIVDLAEPHQLKAVPDIIFDLDTEDWDDRDGFADMLFCLEVFEYLIEPLHAMENIYKMLLPRGKAFVTFPLVYPVHNPVKNDYFRYTINGVNRLAELVGFKIISIDTRKDKSGLLERFYQADGMRAASGADHSTTGYIVGLQR